jgi:hypothetical protein
MLRKVSNSTIELIKGNDILKLLKLSTPLTDEDVDILFDYFEQQEINCVQLKESGKQIDKDYFVKICKAVDDFLIDDDNNNIDISDLNEKLKTE